MWTISFHHLTDPGDNVGRRGQGTLDTSGTAHHRHHYAVTDMIHVHCSIVLYTKLVLFPQCRVNICACV